MHALSIAALCLLNSGPMAAGEPDRPADAAIATGSDHPMDWGLPAEQLRAELGVPALVFAATDDTRTILRGVAGRRSADRPTPALIDDRFHLGSLTKSMTATLAAILVERGDIAWDTTVARACPALAEPDGDTPSIPQAARAITLAQLLAHRSGLPDDRMGGPMLLGMWSLAGPITGQRAQAARAMLSQSNNKEPGAGFAYANANYIVAGHMLEAVTGRSWEELIRAELFDPLGMATAGQGPPGMGMDDPESGLPPQPLGHGRTPDGPQPIPAILGADNPPAFGPAGRVHASIDDLAAYARAHLAGLRGQDGLLPAAAFEHLHADPESDAYALGWVVMADPEHPDARISLHAGSNTRWLAHACIMPERNLAVVCAMNAMPADADADPLARILSLLTDAGVLTRTPNTGR